MTDAEMVVELEENVQKFLQLLGDCTTAEETEDVAVNHLDRAESALEAVLKSLKTQILNRLA